MDRYTSEPFLKRTIVFQFLRVVFGITSSAFLLNDTIRIWFAFGFKFTFDLQKWVTNNFSLPKYFDQMENLLSKSHSFTENDDRTFLESKIKFISNDLKRVLWVEWDNQNNRFVFHYSSLIDLERSLERSKRNVLKLVHLFMIH